MHTYNFSAYNLHNTSIDCNDKTIGLEANATCEVLKSVEVSFVIDEARTGEILQKQKKALNCPSFNSHYGFYYENSTVPDPCLIITFKQVCFAPLHNALLTLQPDGWQVDDVAGVSVGCNMSELSGHTSGWTVEPTRSIPFNT